MRSRDYAANLCTSTPPAAAAHADEEQKREVKNEAGLCLLLFLYSLATNPPALASAPGPVSSSGTLVARPLSQSGQIASTQPVTPTDKDKSAALSHSKADAGAGAAGTNKAGSQTQTHQHGLPHNTVQHTTDGFRVIRSSASGSGSGRPDAGTNSGGNDSKEATVTAMRDSDSGDAHHINSTSNGNKNNKSVSKSVSVSTSPSTAKKHIHFDDSAIQYHTVPARGDTVEDSGGEGGEYLAYPLMTETPNTQQQTKNKSQPLSQPPPPQQQQRRQTVAKESTTKETIHFKYQILNRDPKHLINHADLDLVFGSNSSGKALKTTIKGPKRPHSVATTTPSVSQRQQYLVKTTHLEEKQQQHRLRRAQAAVEAGVDLEDEEDEYDEGVSELEKRQLLLFLARELGVRATPSGASESK